MIPIDHQNAPQSLSSLSPLGVTGIFKPIHRHLTEHGCDRVSSILRSANRSPGSSSIEAAGVRDGLTEHGCCFSKCERRLMENSLFSSEEAVNTVTEFMGKCRNVARSRCPIEQHVRVMGRDRICTERPLVYRAEPEHQSTARRRPSQQPRRARARNLRRPHVRLRYLPPSR